MRIHEIAGKHWSPARLSEDVTRFRYIGNCTMPACAAYLSDMMDHARKVSFKELLTAVGRETLADTFSDYYWGKRPNRMRGDMALNQDPYVSYYKSTYRDVSCYFVEQSGVEYIFVSTEYDNIDWSDPSHDKSAKRFYILDDGTVQRALPPHSVVLSVTVAGDRFKVIQSTALTPEVAAAMLKLIQQYKPTMIRDGDDEEDVIPVRQYVAWLQRS